MNSRNNPSDPPPPLPLSLTTPSNLAIATSAEPACKEVLVQDMFASVDDAASDDEGEVAVKVELTKADDSKSLNSGRPELWVRVLSDEVLAPSYFKDHLVQLYGQQIAGYNPSPVKFYSDLAGAWDDEDDDSGYAHESWWILEKKGF